MSRHLLKAEMKEVQSKLIELSVLIEDSLDRALKAIKENDLELAKDVILQDHKIDMMEVRLEEECLRTLALHQPVATDLRFIVAVLKINNDLERVGDLAVNIAKRTRFLKGTSFKELPFDFKKIASLTKFMLRASLDAFIRLDADLAREVCETDNEVDTLHKSTYVSVIKKVQEIPDQIEISIQCLSISRFLERIADYATNIAEDVIYLTSGKIVRHYDQTSSTVNINTETPTSYNESN